MHQDLEGFETCCQPVELADCVILYAIRAAELGARPNLHSRLCLGGDLYVTYERFPRCPVDRREVSIKKKIPLDWTWSQLLAARVLVDWHNRPARNAQIYDCCPEYRKIVIANVIRIQPLWDRNIALNVDSDFS